MSQAGSPPRRGKPVGLLVRELLSSFRHLQSVIRPLQPQPMSLLSRAINLWDSALNGEIADNGHPVAYNSTSHNHTPQMCSSTLSYQAFFSQNPVVATAPYKPLCLGLNSPFPPSLPPSTLFFCTPHSNQANWPWGVCKCPSCTWECPCTSASSIPSSHPKSKSSLPGGPP